MAVSAEKAAARTRRECDLYAPVRDLLAARGFVVRGEVKDCDVTATRGGDLVVVELKLSVNVGLLVQAIERQKVADAVYVAVPEPAGAAARAGWRGARKLLRRLELGLIVVRDSASGPRAAIDFHPTPCQKRRNPKRRAAIVAEMAGRSGDHNVGGSSRTRILTAYRESALFLACCLERHGPLSPARLRALGGGPKTQPMLASNYYGWFERVDRGLYALNAAGAQALAAYPELVAACRARLDEAATPAADA